MFTVYLFTTDQKRLKASPPGHIQECICLNCTKSEHRLWNQKQNSASDTVTLFGLPKTINKSLPLLFHMQHAPHRVITLNKTCDPCRETERGSLLQSTADMKNNASLTNWNWNSPQMYYEDLQEFTRPWPVSAGWGAKSRRSGVVAWPFVLFFDAQHHTKRQNKGTQVEMDITSGRVGGSSSSSSS